MINDKVLYEQLVGIFALKEENGMLEPIPNEVVHPYNEDGNMMGRILISIIYYVNGSKFWKLDFFNGEIVYVDDSKMKRNDKGDVELFVENGVVKYE